jgi:MFS family permease
MQKNESHHDANQASTSGLAAFGYADFRWFFFTRFVSSFAMMMVAVGVGWQVYDIARQSYGIKESAFYIGMVGLAQFISLAIFSLIGGYASDRYDRRWVARGALLIEIISIALLFWLSLNHTRSIWAIVLSVGLVGVGRAFIAPSMQALAPSLVPTNIFPSAIAWNSIAWQIAAVGGPALCGYLISGGMAIVYGSCLALMCVAFIMLLFIKAPAESHRIRLTTQPLRSIIDGLAYLRTNKLVFGAISLDLFAVLLGSATAMLPVYARDILHGLGHLRAAPACGAALVALCFALRPLRRHAGAWMFASVGIYGLSTIGFGVSHNFHISMLCLMILGASDMVSVYVRSSLVQINTPDDKRGRVSSVSTLFISASNELGEFQSGFSARFLGVTESVIIGGVAAIIVTLIWTKCYPQLRYVDTLLPDNPKV